MGLQDIDFGQCQIFVRGGKDRVTFLPRMLSDELQLHIERVKELHRKDVAEGFGKVYLPNALAKKYCKAAYEEPWQYAFPSKTRSIAPRSGKTRRHHVMESGLQKAVKAAVRKTGIDKRATVHTLRDSFEVSISSLICNPFTRKWNQHSCAPRTSWPCRCKNNRNLHPCNAKRPR